MMNRPIELFITSSSVEEANAVRKLIKKLKEIVDDPSCFHSQVSRKKPGNLVTLIEIWTITLSHDLVDLFDNFSHRGELFDPYTACTSVGSGKRAKRRRSGKRKEK